MRPDEVPAELKRIVDQAAGKEHSAEGAVMTCLRAVLDRHEAMVRAKVAEEFRSAAQAIEDTRGENDDPLADEIWRECRRSLVATSDDPRTIANVTYRYLARQITRGAQ